MKKNYETKLFNKDSVVLIANSSWYLFHYRSLLIEKLKKKNLFPILIAPRDEFTKKFTKEVDFFEWDLIRKNSLNFLLLFSPFFKLYKIIRNLKPALIHSHTIKPNLFISIISSLLGIRTILSFAGLGILGSKNGFKKYLLKIIFKVIYFFSIRELKFFIFLKINYSRTTFIFQNPIDKKEFLKLLNIRNNNLNINIIPGSGIPEKYLIPFKNRGNLIHEKSNCFIYCARLLKSKGILEFLELSTKFPESEFFVYGDVDQFSKETINKSEINEFSIKFKNVRFLGFINDPLMNHINDNPILIVPSIYGEGLPRAILEAICLGIPVIATRKACAEIFNERQVFIVNENNTESLTFAINQIIHLKNNNQLKKFLIESKKYIEAKFNEKIIVENTLKLYDLN